MSIIDTHCHLSQYPEESLSKIISEAKRVGVDYLIDVGFDLSSSLKAAALTEVFSNVFAAVGLHPNEKQDFSEVNLEKIEELINSNSRVVAVGEIGLDYYRRPGETALTASEKEEQKHWFLKQLQIAKKYGLPVLLHIRSAFEDALAIVKEVGGIRGVVHCFCGNEEQAREFVKLGFFISFAGNVTFPSKHNLENYKKIVNSIPLERVVVETDAPYLTPTPFRGTANYPKYIVHTLQKLSDLRSLDYESLEKACFANSLTALNLQVGDEEKVVAKR